MNKKYFLLILLFSLLISCGQLNEKKPCNCEIEKNALTEIKTELAELKKLQAPILDIPSNKILPESILMDVLVHWNFPNSGDYRNT